MLITLTGAAIGSGLAAAVPPITLAAGTGVSVVAVETAERPMLVSMLLAGRLRAETGAVLVDGADDPDELRRRTALVDTPVVAEPTAGLRLSTVKVQSARLVQATAAATATPAGREAWSFTLVSAQPPVPVALPKGGTP